MLLGPQKECSSQESQTLPPLKASVYPASQTIFCKREAKRVAKGQEEGEKILPEAECPGPWPPPSQM